MTDKIPPEWVERTKRRYAGLSDFETKEDRRPRIRGSTYEDLIRLRLGSTETFDQVIKRLIEHYKKCPKK